MRQIILLSRQTNLSKFHVDKLVLVDGYVPHGHHSAGSCSDDGRGIGTGGTQRLSPVTQALAQCKNLEMDRHTKTIMGL